MTPVSTLAVSAPKLRLSLTVRLAILACLFFAEKWLLNGFVDSERAQAAQGLGALVRILQHWGFRFLVTFYATLVIFAYVRGADGLKRAAVSIRALPVRLGWLLAHFLLIAALMPLVHLLYREPMTGALFLGVLTLSLALALSAGLAGLLAFAPRPLWVETARALGIIWVYASVAALLGVGAWQASEHLWGPTAGLTFELVRVVLSRFLPTLSADAATRVLGTQQFAVQITEVCSGLEGMGLMLAFSAVWLLYFRREYTFPRALLLIPLGLFAMFALNVLRISALVLIGNAGFPDVALFGFHSQAGWLAFNSVACGLVFLSRRSAWFRGHSATAARAASGENPTAAYLMPLLAILAAGALSHAMSGVFEIFYPLRLIAAIAMLYCYRRTLVTLSWRFSWRGPAVGIIVFVLWVVGAHFLTPHATMPDALAAMSPAMRTFWLASRTAAAVLIVPVAEELAYRGYLMRRLIDEAFESVAFASVTWPFVLATAVVFGLAHGALWLPGIVAGAAYGFLAQRRGALGEAVAAHAVTNALIATLVLAGDQWQLW